ncbi:MAG: polysaccharide biosynthesis protein [Coriobacteriales bacterium]|jgi:FlaA1/EpsC-like NDP-sugar epimerase
MDSSKLTTRVIVLVFWDIFATYAAYLLATVGTGQAEDVLVSTDVLFYIGLIAIINIVVFAAFRLYNDMWEYASAPETLKIVAATALATFLSAALLFLVSIRFPIRVYFVAWLILLVFVGGARYMFRIIRYGKGHTKMPAKSARKRTLIVGAGETAAMTINRMSSGDYYMEGNPLVAVDDDPSKRGMRIHGVKVAGNRHDIVPLVEKYDIEQIVIAIPSASSEDLRAIYDICMQTNCHLLTLPNVRDIPIDQLDDVKLRDVNVNDLLSREEVVLNTRQVSGYIAGKVVLVTGGGGSIGSEIVRQLCLAAPKQIIVFDIYENTAYELQREIQGKYDDVDIVVEIGSVRDYSRLATVFNKYKPNVVFHAAAHKHVPLMEACPQEAVRNNVFGTMNTARAASIIGVEKFIFISTDKAVNPSSVMGATKKFGEMIVQSFDKNSDTVFANVLGSHGSVIPLFKEQIANGGPVTVTHPDMTRYFMTIPEASRLVIQAGGIAKGGEIFILNMGEPVKIVDLARKLIILSGLRPDKDIKIVYTGLRPGEKLTEQLWTDAERTTSTSIKDIMISTDEPEEPEVVEKKLAELAESLSGSSKDIKECLSKQLPTYKPRITESDYDEIEFD